MIDPNDVGLPEIPPHKTTSGKFNPQDVLWDPPKKSQPGKVIYDPDVQRQWREAHMKSISKGWNPALADNIHLSVRPDGTKAIIDGAHTTGAAAENAVKMLMSIDHHGLTKAQEAAFHLRHQSARKADSAGDKWKLKIQAEIPEYVAAEKMLKKYGLAVGSQIRAAGAVDYVISNYGHKVLEKVVITMNAWAKGDKAAREDWEANAVIRALGWLHGHHPLVAEPGQLGRKLQKKTTPRGMAGHIAAIAKGGGGSGSRTTIGAREIAKIWNIRRAPANQYPLGVLEVLPTPEDEEGEEDED